jgi:hypothetical protein
MMPEIDVKSESLKTADVETNFFNFDKLDERSIASPSPRR